MNWPFVKNKIVVVYNGRSIANQRTREDSRVFLTQIEPRLLPYLNDFWSMTIAELHPIKRHDAVIEAMREVVKQLPHTRHLIIGGGQEEGKLQQKIIDLDLTENIFLLGTIAEAAEYLKASDLFILASRSEAMPYAIIEATIAGLPIIATNVGGIPEVIENEKSGLLVKPLDNVALNKAILEVRNNDKLRQKIAIGAKERSRDFNFHKTLEKTITIYRSRSLT